MTAPTPTDPNQGRSKYNSPADGLKALQEDIRAWSGALGDRAVAASYAVIAANWAVFTTTKGILSNKCALWSISVAVGFLGLSLTVPFATIAALASQERKAEKDKTWWMTEFNDRMDPESRWPYSGREEWISSFFDVFKFLLPFAATVLFILAVWKA